jgi:hypothetical protein
MLLFISLLSVTLISAGVLYNLGELDLSYEAVYATTAIFAASVLATILAATAVVS